jgi:vacuolar-type H+-ATPase subunit C/Vma6
LAVVQQLVVLAHPDGSRLLPLVNTSQRNVLKVGSPGEPEPQPVAGAVSPDLLAIDVALLAGFADRAHRAATRANEPLGAFVRMLIDAGNAENALLLAGESAAIDPSTLFVSGGRWVPVDAFLAVSRSASYQQAVGVLAASVAHSPLALSLPVVAADLADVDRMFIVAILERFTRASHTDPLSTAPLLRVLLLIEAQSRDLRALAWGAVLGTPPSLRIRQLVTRA